MKKALLIFFLSAMAFRAVAADDDRYMQAMKAAVSTLDTAKTYGTYQTLTNQFERIAGVTQKEWLPYYYAAYCGAVASFMNKNKRNLDDVLDKCQGWIDKADSLMPNNSEIYAVKGMILQARIGVNPMSRGKKFGTMANDLLEKSKELNKNNPRPYYLQAQGLFYTPKMFGGGKEKAKPVAEEAVAKYADFKPLTDISPHWGAENAKKLVDDCSN